MKINCAVPYSNTITHHHVETDCPQPRSCSDTLFKIIPAHCHSFAPEWQKCIQEAEQHDTETLNQSKIFYNAHVHSLPDITMHGSTVALTKSPAKL